MIYIWFRPHQDFETISLQILQIFFQKFYFVHSFLIVWPKCPEKLFSSEILFKNYQESFEDL